MRVLVTGATGFVGARLLPLLSEHELLCTSRDPVRLPQRTGLTGIAADLTRDGDWTDKIAAFKPEWCFHLAWEGLPDYSLNRCRINLDAGLRVLDAVARAGVRKIVVAGSCWEYGRVSGAVSEDTAPVDVGIFAATKRALLTVVESMARDADFQYRWARVFFAYGAGQRSSALIPHLHRAYAEGRPPEVHQPSAIQDFIHIDDVAEALVALAVSDVSSGIFNVGSGQPTSVGHVANRAAAFFGTPPPFQVAGRADGCWADMTKTAACTGWRAKVTVDEGIERTLASLREVA